MIRVCAGSLLVITLKAGAASHHVPAEYSTIQAAVDAAADGDTIHAAAGVYREQVRIVGKSITLIGEPGTIVRAFPNMDAVAESRSITRSAVLSVVGCTEVVVRGFSFEGDQLGGEQAATFNGALFFDSGGIIEECRFVGFRAAVPGPAKCEAIEVFNWRSAAVHLEMNIRRNTIVDCYAGMRIIGRRDRTTLTISVADNVISGVGPTTTESDLEGIEVQEGVVGEVVRNTVSGMSYTGERNDRFGVGLLAISFGFPIETLIPLQPLRIANNTLRNNQVHAVLAMADGSTFDNNVFQGTAPGGRTGGLLLSGQGIKVRGNEFRDMPEGILVAGMDPDFGTLLGLSVDAQLVDNRLRDVPTPVETQPGGTATEEGTLVYPFPAPEPTFETALKISWPSYYEDWELQCSEDAENWDVVNLPIMQQDGVSMVTVPAEEDHEFFRLIETTP